MSEERTQRRLSTILAADVVGYSKLMEADEEAALRTLKGYREVIDRLITRHDGRIFGTAGDSVIAEFGSAVEAVRAAIAIQEELAARNAQLPDDRGMTLRIGVNLGDVMVDGKNLYGDGINVAARIEGLCAPGEVYVSDSVHGQVEGKLTVGFEDNGEHSVKNIAKPVRVYRVRTTDNDEINDDATGNELPLPDKPSIAVLAFENMSGDHEQGYFADGIAEDIITKLSKISGLFVIARHSSFIYKGKPVSVKQVGRDLGVRYVLEGSVRKAGNRLRITAQLIDSESDHHLWAESYDRDIEDIFAIQDDVARRVAEALEVALTPGESRRLAQAPTDNLEAYDIYLSARSKSWPPIPNNLSWGLDAYGRVIEMDSTFAGGYAGKSMMHSLAVLFGYSKDPEGDEANALELAQRAMKLDRDFPRSHSALGFAHLALGQYKESISAARLAIELQPGDADSHAWYSFCLREAGFADEACTEAKIALRLDPYFVQGPYLNLLGRAEFLAGRHKEAMDAFERNAMRGGPSRPLLTVVWAAACSLAGHVERGHELVQDVLREQPDLCLKMIPNIRPRVNESELERLKEGLRLAGLPE